MEKRKVKVPGIPKFANEQDEANWWASAGGRGFVKEHSARKGSKGPGGSKLVAKLARANSGP